MSLIARLNSSGSNLAIDRDKMSPSLEEIARECVVGHDTVISANLKAS